MPVAAPMPQVSQPMPQPFGNTTMPVAAPMSQMLQPMPQPFGGSMTMPVDCGPQSMPQAVVVMPQPAGGSVSIAVAAPMPEAMMAQPMPQPLGGSFAALPCMPLQLAPGMPGGSFSMPVAMPSAAPAAYCGNPGCSQPGIYTCSKCGMQSYCSAECQKKHWPEHKKMCKMMQSAAPPVAGAPPMGGNMPLCWKPGCGKPGLYTCGKCGQAAYCSSDCQS